MRKLALIALLVTGSTVYAEEPWKPLFNGKDLAGWEHVGPGSFTVEGGLLTTHGGMGLLWYTREKFGNAVIRAVFRANTTRGNSGVFIRITDRPRDPWYGVHFGYEVQVEEAGDDYHRTGVIYSMNKAQAKPPSGPDGWNTMEITLDGQRTIVFVNGVKVTDFYGSQAVPERKMWYEPERGPRPDVGYIGVQNHDAASTVQFREVSVRPLDPARRSAAMGFQDWSKVPSQKLPDGLSRQILFGKNVMFVRVVLAADAAPAAHHHPHEQWTLVEKGPVLFQVGGEERRLETGAMIYIPSDVMHGARSLGSGAVLVDVFSPIREDFLQ